MGEFLHEGLIMTDAEVAPLPSFEGPASGHYFGSVGEKLDLQHCGTCGTWIFYPRVACPGCLSTDSLSWKSVTGDAAIMSFSRIYRSQHPFFEDGDPRILLAVELREGPVILVNADESIDDPRIGDEVRLVRVEIAPGIRVPIASAKTRM